MCGIINIDSLLLIIFVADRDFLSHILAEEL